MSRSPTRRQRRRRRGRRRPTRVTAARSALSGGIRSTLGLPMEERLLVVAQGIDFHNHLLPAEWRIPDCLMSGNLRIPGVIRVSSTEARYTNQAQRVRYTVRVITDKQHFHEYLEGRRGRAYGNNVLVIYDGHARYGRGPCLGTTNAPGEHWGMGADPRIEGIYRMAYPYLSIPGIEILEHQYRAMVARQQTSDPNLTAVNVRTLNRSNDIHPHLRPRLNWRRRTKGYALSELDTMVQRLQDEVAAAVASHRTLRSTPMSDLYGELKEILEHRNAGRHSFAPYIYGATGANERFWATWRYERISYKIRTSSGWQARKLLNPNRRNRRFIMPHIILYADWQNTVSGTWRPAPASPPAAMDLGATYLRCRGFCHFGCSTFVHNYRVMRFMKRWQRSADGNDRLCYWTSASAPMDIGPYWLYHMLTYIPGRERRFRTRNWGDVVEYARIHTNDDLSLDGKPYEVR